MARVLAVDDDPRLLKALEMLIADAGHEPATSTSAEEGIQRAHDWRPGVVLLDLQLPGLSGIEAMAGFRDVLGPVPIVIMTGASSMESAVEAARLGAWEYLTKPVDPAHLIQLIDKAITDGAEPHPAGSTGEDAPVAPWVMIGQSTAMQQIYRLIGQVSATDSTVLLRGESGTGKELVAHAIHRFSARSTGPMVVVNCVAIPETLLETELFGHERGAFTGAVQRRVGRFERAQGGTIFLDEIGDLPLGLQSKLLRMLQNRTFERVGGTETLRSDARIIAATNRDLESAMRLGKFRDDLFHRLNVVTITLPPLREHREDVPELVRHFLSHHSRHLGTAPANLAADAIAPLLEYGWPGNVRELEHCIERALIFSRGYAIGPDEIRKALQVTASHGRGATTLAEAVDSYLRAILSAPEPEAFHKLTEAFEALVLREAMRQTGGSQAAAARLLGLPRPTLHAKLQRHGIRSLGRNDSTESGG